jgi:opacity protein-like surface antigen
MLKRISTPTRIALATLALASLPFAAQADTLYDGWYVSGQAGAGYMSRVDFPDGGSVKFQNGLNNHNFGGALGYKSGPLRYEIQGLYGKTDIDSVWGLDVNGSVRIISGFFNVFYDFDQLSTILVPYLGAGLGYGELQSKVDGAKCNDFELTFQGAAGLSLNFNANTALTVDYRYVGSAKSKNGFFDERYANNTVNVGFAYHFSDEMM